MDNPSLVRGSERLGGLAGIKSPAIGSGTSLVLMSARQVWPSTHSMAMKTPASDVPNS